MERNSVRFSTYLIGDVGAVYMMSIRLAITNVTFQKVY